MAAPEIPVDRVIGAVGQRATEGVSERPRQAVGIGAARHTGVRAAWTDREPDADRTRPLTDSASGRSDQRCSAIHAASSPGWTAGGQS